MLTGAVNPSGHLPITFPAGDGQSVRKTIDGKDAKPDAPFTARYVEGAAVGYKWHDLHTLKPLFAFGHGLSYKRFDFGDATAVRRGRGLEVRFTVTNRGARSGAAVGQVYVAPQAGGWEAPRRLGAFAKTELAPGHARTVTVSIDPRLLATFDEAAHDWVIAPGRYEIQLGAASDDIRQRVLVTLPEARFSAARPLSGGSRPADSAGSRSPGCHDRSWASLTTW